jgi:hypothetical protein
MWSDGRSSRCGEALISSAVPVRAQARNSSPKSTSTGGRLPIRRVVGWPMTLTRDVEQHPLAALPVYLDAAGDPLRAPGPEPGQAVQPARLDRRRQVGDGLDAEIVAKLQGAFGAEAGHPGQLEDPGRYLRAQLVQRADAPGVAVFGDLGRDRGADARNRAERLDVELADVVGPAADRTGSFS